MYTQIPIHTSSYPEPSLLPEPAKLFYSPIYGGETMLSFDKITSCNGSENATLLNGKNLPGATIVSPILLSMAGIAGHVTALFYLYRTTKPSHNRTVFHVLLSTLIWTDLIGKLLTTPPAIISYIQGHWVGGMRLCNLHGFFMMTIGLVTHFLVAAMALDRFLCVRHGYFYKSSVTKSRIRLVLMGIWLFCILFCTMPLFGLGEYEPQYPGTWCYVNIHVGSHTWWYHRLYTNIFGCINILNVITILICNAVVIGTLISARIFRSRNLSASTRQRQKIMPITCTQRELEIQMSILLLIITIVFLVSWCPLDLRLFLNQIWPHTCMQEHVSDLIAIRLASLNQIVDPWAYIICRKVFTSKIWRGCRSVMIGRSFSSKRQNRTLDNNRMLSLENGGSSKSKTNESLSSIKRKFSLPTPEKNKIISNYIVINEANQKSAGNYGKNNCSFNSPGKYGYNLDKGNSPYIPMCKTNAIKPPIHGIVNPLEQKYQPVPNSPFSRKQFRIPVDLAEETNSTYSKTESENMPCQVKASIGGRRHSWSSAPSVSKQYRTRSTQTLENI